MKTFNFLFLAILLLINGLFSQTSQDSPELKEATALTESAVKLFMARKYDEALSPAKKGLEIRERLLPRTDPRIIASLVYLGDIYLAKGDLDPAKKALERASEIQAERSSPNDVSLAPIWDRLAILYHRKGDERKAEELCLRALDVREKTFGPESLRVAYALFALGEFYRAEKDFARAASNYKRSLLIYGKLSGIDKPDFERVSDSFTCLGYQTDVQDVVNQLNEIRKQFAPPQTPQDLAERRILNGMALSLPKPDYSAEARARNLSGTVIVKVEIDEAGKVISAEDMCQGPPYLSQAAVKSAWGARFSPTKLSGKPVKFKGMIQYRFVRQ